MSVRLGIIGIGDIIGRHLHAISQIDEINISCICDINPERLDATVKKLGCKGYENYKELLKEELDVVLVSLPHNLHCSVTVDALKAGCHVMVEKPMAISVDECNLMLDTAKEFEKHIIVTDLASFYPGVVKTGDKFRSGTLGRFFTGGILNIRNYFHKDRPAWFLDPKMSGGGMFSNIGLHRLAVARGCLPGQTPVSVSASVSCIPQYSIEACTTAIVKYEQGGAMTYEEVGYYSKPSWMNSITHFVFEEGIVTLDDRFWRMMDIKGNEWQEELPFVENSYVDIYYEMLKAIKGDKYHPSAYEYAMDVAIAQGTYASSIQGKEIYLNSPQWAIKE